MLITSVIAACCALAGLAAGLVIANNREVAAIFGLSRLRRSGDSSVPASVTGDAPVVSLAALVLDAISSGVIVVDRYERVLLVNPVARAMALTTSDRLVFEDMSELLRECVSTGRTVSSSINLPLDRLGREPIALLVTAVPLPDEHHPERIAAAALLVDDVTEARRLDDVRRDFVANVSHELKTPVGALTLLAEAIQHASDDPDAVAHFASRIQHEGTRLGRLVRELIELSRLQGAEALPGDELVDITTVLDEAQDHTHLSAEQAGIEVVSRASGNLRVRGNEAQLTTAVSNLIDNAIAYSPGSNRVGVSARLVEESNGAGWVEISVSDQGIGMAETDLARVFERFYRVDPARSRATGGTGLGLAIVKHVATNHGGTVMVWSVEGAGSTFTIRLPSAESPDTSTPPTAGSGPAMGTGATAGAVPDTLAIPDALSANMIPAEKGHA